MGVLASMITGISGLSATGRNLNIIGDNIANAGTTGFKQSRGQFHDLVAASLRGVLGGNQIGRGVKLAGVSQTFSQGSVNATERDTDLAITGDGFFVLQGEDGVTFTRDGAFQFDRAGKLSDIDGRTVMGYQTNELGDVTAKMGPVEITQNTVAAKATKTINFNLNLDAREPLRVFDPKQPEKTSSFGTGVQIYDSMGNAHAVTMYFHRTGDGQWTWHAMADGNEVIGGKPGEQFEIAAGTLKYAKDGKLENEQTTKSAINFTNGAQANQIIDFDFGDSIIKDKGTGTKGSTSYGTKSSMYKYVQDGSTAGVMTGMAIDETGLLTGLYSNGETRPLSQIALARFNSNEGLYKLGTNRFKEAAKSGAAVIGKALEGGRGKLTMKALEGSNVDLAEEFVKMIQNQRNFQANAKTITTSDEMLQDVINLKR